jgi:hypothetical protein
MRVKLLVLGGTAFVPLALAYCLAPSMSPGFLGGSHYSVFCFVSGLLWCSLFGYFYVRGDAKLRRRIWWLSPLVLFAFVLPAEAALLWVAIYWAIWNGATPP